MNSEENKQTAERVTNTESVDNGSLNNLLSLGCQLKTARDKAGLSIGEVSKKLLISKARLVALELDDYSALPAKVFVIGYIKKYAELLSVDENALLHQYEKYCETVKADGEDKFLMPSTTKITLNKNIFGSQRSLPKWILPLGVFSVAVLVLLSTIFFSDREGRNQSPEKIKTIVSRTVEENILEQAMETTLIAGESTKTFADTEHEGILDNNEPVNLEETLPVELDKSNPALVKSVLVEQATKENVGNMLEVALQKSVSAEQSSVLSNAEELDLTARFESPQKIDTLVFSFIEECWLNVKEVEGNVIYSGTAAAGSKLTLEGRGPFELMVGNADATSLLVNGKPVPIEPQSGRKTAKLSVGE
ncbi:MAG: DUF4115 domain-containing protein [Cellvibrionaceae bacterium]